MKLRFKILFMCLGSTLLALLCQTWLFQVSSSSIIYNWAKTENENSLTNMQNEIYTQLKHMETTLMRIYNEEALISALTSDVPVGELQSEFYRQAYDIGISYFDSGDDVLALYLYTPEHAIISTYRKAVTPKHNYPSDIFSDLEEYNAQVVIDYVDSSATGLLISSYYNPYREDDIIRFVLKLFSNRNYKEPIGYVVCDADSDVFTSLMEKYCMDSSVIMWLQPAGDRPVASVGTFAEGEQKTYLEISGQVRARADLTVDAGAEKEFFMVDQSKYNLTAYSLTSQGILKKNQRTLTMNLLLIVGVMVIVVGLLYVYISKTLTRPLVRLTDTMGEIRAGHRDIRSDIQRKDEIGTLAVNFNEMLDTMQELQEKEKQTAYLLNQAEYKALQAQINPHFLYNTLDVMSSIAEFHGCPEVSTLSQSLSNIFRYSLNMKDTFSTISMELAHLKNYIFVMEMRMNGQIQYVYDIDEGALQVQIPKLSLQPLVENALNHGLRNKHGEKRIRIEAKLRMDRAYICVTDNGTGMDCEEISRRLSQNDISYIEKGDSIGLDNINARLRMFYGEAWGLHVSSRPGEGTSVFFEVPLAEKGDGDGIHSSDCG